MPVNKQYGPQLPFVGSGHASRRRWRRQPTEPISADDRSEIRPHATVMAGIAASVGTSHETRADGRFGTSLSIGTTWFLVGGRMHGPLVRPACSRRTLKSASTNRLVAPFVKLSTVGNRAFVVAAPLSCGVRQAGVLSPYLFSVD